MKIRKVIIVLGIILIISVLLVALFFNVLMVPQIAKNLWRTAASEIDFAIPGSVTIIDEFKDSPDFFGDYSCCVVFRLSDQSIDRLIKNEIPWWAVSDEKCRGQGGNRKAHIVTWQEGQLPDDIMSSTNSLNVHLGKSPSPSATYIYLHRWVDGGWWRLLVIDKNENLVYYYRVTW